MIKLRFVQGGQIDSKVIRWDTRCLWSHVECMWTDKTTFGAMLKGGVCERLLSNRNYKDVTATEVWEIQCSAGQENAFHDWMRRQNGKPYDWRAILSFGLGSRDWRAEDSWFCSELVSRALEVAELLKLPKDIPVNRITPRDVWVLIAGMTTERVSVKL
jgi:uncharacterized protein YycO